MKTLSTWMLFPIVMLAVGLLLLLIRILPQGWRALPLGLVALLLTAIPAQTGDERMVTCYEPVAVNQNQMSTEALMATPEWTNFRSAYISLLDYMAVSKFNEADFSKLVDVLSMAEAALNQSIIAEGVSQKTMTAIFDGMKASTTGYQRENVGPTCYKMMVTPELERRFALADAVNRQVQIRKLIMQNTIVAPETIRLTKESIFADIGKYLSGDDLEQYRTLMLDLAQISNW
jgi:hypothetical protein